MKDATLFSRKESLSSRLNRNVVDFYTILLNNLFQIKEIMKRDGEIRS